MTTPCVWLIVCTSSSSEQVRLPVSAEIVTIARKIGTLDTSILPYEDCCTVFTPKHPKTKPVLALVEAEEAKLDVDALVADALANTEKVAIRYYED